MSSNSTEEIRERILVHLSQHHAQTAGEIAKALHLSIAVVTSNLGCLTRSQKLVKVHHPGWDRARYRVAGTADSRAGVESTAKPKKPASTANHQAGAQNYNARFWNAFIRRAPIPEK